MYTYKKDNIGPLKAISIVRQSKKTELYIGSIDENGSLHDAACQTVADCQAIVDLSDQINKLGFPKVYKGTTGRSKKVVEETDEERAWRTGIGRTVEETEMLEKLIRR